MPKGSFQNKWIDWRTDLGQIRLETVSKNRRNSRAILRILRNRSEAKMAGRWDASRFSYLETSPKAATVTKNRLSSGARVGGRRVALILLFFYLVSFFAQRAYAEVRPMDAVLVLDLSGSMGKTKQGERYQDVLGWVLRLGTPEDRIGLVAFGRKEQVEREMQLFGDFNPKLLEGKLNKLDQFTNLAAGLERAYYMLKTTARPQAARRILLFSDGRIDLPGGIEEVKASERYLREVLLAGMQKEQIQLFAFIPTGLKADYRFLQELAEKSGGEYVRGLPAAPDQFRISRLVAPKIPADHPSLLQTGRIIPKIVETKNSTREPSSLAPAYIVVFGATGLSLFIITLVFLVIRPSLKAREQARELAAVLEDVRGLRQEMVDELGSKPAEREQAGADVIEKPGIT
jgi:hypothetical protein